MRDRVTVIPEDKYIAVDGGGLVFETAFPADENIHAIQWKDGIGDMELKEIIENSPGMWVKNLSFTDYEIVRPFVEMFEAEQLILETRRLEQEQYQQEEAQYGDTHDYVQETKEWIPNLEKARNAFCRRVNILRDSYIAGGTSFDFSNEETAFIETRNEKDIRNVLTNAVKALAFIAAGAPETPMVFRTGDDITRQITAQEMMEMADTVGTNGQYYYDISWTHKDKINGKTEHSGELLDTFEKVTAYDYTVGWES